MHNKEKCITVDYSDRPYLTISVFSYLLTEIAYSGGRSFKNESAVPSGHEEDNTISTATRIYRGKYKALRPDAPRNSLIDPLFLLLNIGPRFNGTNETLSFIDNRIARKTDVHEHVPLIRKNRERDKCR